MILTSLRWRLPLSYAGIALIAALSLGAVLLTTLRSYYAQQELGYLNDNATAIGLSMVEIGAPDAPREWLSAHLRSFSFLSQVRIRLFDRNAGLLGDSGSPGEQNMISIGYSNPPDSALLMDWLLPAPEQTDAFDTLNFLPSIMFFRDDAEWAVQEDGRLEERNLSQRRAFALPATRTLYGFKLDQQTPSSNMPRSNEKVRTAIQFPNGNLAGYVELSEGPAYGAEIVSGVASAWVAASVVAVCIAGGVGLLISRRMSQPLVALTDVTARMAGGDLSARARIYGVDEAGILAQSFNGMAARVEDTILTLRRFVADAAHELHTPLTALRTNLELAVLEENERLTYIERAQSQVLRLETLTSDLLELSRLEAHVVQTHRNVVNLTQLSHEMGELYASQAEQKGIDFTLDMPEADVKVVADAPKIQRALDNLLQNAIKFTPSGGTIRLGVRRSADWIDIWVQDDGIGIPTDDLTQLFSRFHRGRNAATYPGSGLGLAIVKAIAEYHHGQVIAENCRPGARLSLRLPAPT